MNKKALIIGASPRKGGNSHTACEIIATMLSDSQWQSKTLFIRDYDVRPCTGCGYCEKYPHQCMIQDQAENIFHEMSCVGLIIVVSPVYFYAFPAQFKALIDRSQKFYFTDSPLKKSNICAVLIAGRTKGQRLFEGCMLSLKPFADVLGAKLQPVLELRALDAKEALRADFEACKMVQNYVQQIIAYAD